MGYVVTPPSTVGVPVNGTGDLFPVRRIFCVGRNYAAHAREMGHDPDREPPFFFTKPADAIVVNEYWATRAILACEAPGSFYHHPPAAGLGWGMPAALGVQLAQRDRTVIAALGDGAYMFANPAACHQAAAAMELPLLTILCNNARWHAVQNAAQTLYPEGHAARHATPVPLADLTPTPAFEMYAQASGGHGEVVGDPAALPDAIARALRVVREDRRQVLLNVLCE